MVTRQVLRSLLKGMAPSFPVDPKEPCDGRKKVGYVDRADVGADIVNFTNQVEDPEADQQCGALQEADPVVAFDILTPQNELQMDLADGVNGSNEHKMVETGPVL